MRVTTLFTVGYEGRTIDDFVATLKNAGVARIIDVRELPLSRRQGFSKTRLSQILDDAGIEYVHLRAAGNPYRELKHDVRRCLRLYRSYIEKHPDVVDELQQLATAKKTALLCFEADPMSCHRSILTERMAATVRIRHL